MTEDLSQRFAIQEKETGVASPVFRIPAADLLISLGIVLTTFAAYARVVGFGFIRLDDGSYVYENLHLRTGQAAALVKWIFLSFDPDNWFPLTRLSLLLDYKLFGLRAGFYHAENLILHCLAALFLFGFLRQATRARWPSAFVAFIFALHPLHAESVAWVAERKDVLCALFWFAALWQWVRYTERPEAGRYIGALVLFILGLMSKPMIVTLPCLLFLLDLWPLRRRLSVRLIIEKIPFFAAAGAVAAITVFAQRSAGAIEPLDKFPLHLRIENALVTVGAYIADTLWPSHLWLPYAYPRSVPGSQVVAAAAGIAIVSAVAILQIRRRPYLAVGWFWFLGTLIPVIGLVQVGQQPRADRYMYVPMVGLAVMLAWGIAEAGATRPVLRRWASALAIAACFAMAIKTSFQTGYWTGSAVLFRHAVDMDSRNYLAWDYLGRNFARSSEHAFDAIACYREGLQIRPDDAELHNNLGFILCQINRFEQGIAEYREALRINPARGVTHTNLGEALFKLGRRDEAIAELETAIRLDPRSAPAHSDLGTLLWTTPGRSADGLRHLETAVEINPDLATAQCNLGLALLNTPNRLGDSIPHFKEALRVNPEMPLAHRGLAAACARLGLASECPAP